MPQGPLGPPDPHIPPRLINNVGQSTDEHVMAEVCRACDGTCLIRFAYAPNHRLKP